MVLVFEVIGFFGAVLMFGVIFRVPARTVSWLGSIGGAVLFAGWVYIGRRLTLPNETKKHDVGL